ncbi:MAG: DUF1844 domain-containing protein [Acidobacteriaceae bacterium]
MSEKEPELIVMDRRKFNPDGAPREDAPKEPEMAESTPISEAPKSVPEAVQETQAEDELPAGPTEQETAESHSAYKESSKNLDDMIRAANPGMQPLAEMDFNRLVQSVYMTAMMQMGAGTPEGQQPRLDILGARQSIDMLGVLTDKTTGNLTEGETRLLQSALFELRMAFLEITQAIARSATQPPPPGKPSIVK